MTTAKHAGGPSRDFHSTNSRVSENVIVMMFRAGITQSELAKRTQISQPTISRKLAGGSAWSLPEVSVLSHVLELSEVELMGQLPDVGTWTSRLHPTVEPAVSPEESSTLLRADDGWAPRGSNPEPAVWEDYRPDLRLVAPVIDLAAWRQERAA